MFSPINNMPYERKNRNTKINIVRITEIQLNMQERKRTSESHGIDNILSL